MIPSNTMMRFGLVFLVILTSFALIRASPPLVTPGPRQVCTCFPPDTPDVCPGVDGSNSKTPSKTPSKPGIPSSTGQCSTAQRISVKISFVADDFASLFICGRLVSSTSDFGERADITYEGGCGDLIFLVSNTGGTVGLSALVDTNRRRYGTTERGRKHRVPGTTPLLGVTQFKPEGEFFTNPSDFDFSSWKNAVVVPALSDHISFRTMSSQGAFPISISTERLTNGVYGLRLKLPFCT